jgi:hypothetical protein
MTFKISLILAYYHPQDLILGLSTLQDTTSQLVLKFYLVDAI